MIRLLVNLICENVISSQFIADEASLISSYFQREHAIFRGQEIALI